MKKNIVILILIILVISLSGHIVYNKINNDNQQYELTNMIDNTVIDEYYLAKLNEDVSTYEINDIANKYMNAWKNEFANIVNNIKEKLVYEEDKNIFDQYYMQYERIALQRAEAEYLKFVDTTIPQSERLAGTASSYSSILAMKDIYKQGAISLIKYYENVGEGKIYTYIFRGEK